MSGWLPEPRPSVHPVVIQLGHTRPWRAVDHRTGSWAIRLFALGGSALVAMSLLGALVFHPHDRSANPMPTPSGADSRLQRSVCQHSTRIPTHRLKRPMRQSRSLHERPTAGGTSCARPRTRAMSCRPSGRRTEFHQGGRTRAVQRRQGSHQARCPTAHRGAISPSGGLPRSA